MEKIYQKADFKELIASKGYFLFGNYDLLYFHEQEQNYVIAHIDPLREDYDISDYLALPESAPFELINGKLIFMAAPSLLHQKISHELSLALGNYVKKHKLGQIFAAPCDVCFDDKNNFQPDLIFVSVERLSILQTTKIKGSPDLQVEILSDSTENRDYNEKMQAYGKFGVLEYWIINTKIPKIEVYENQKGEMKLTQSAGLNGSIKSKTIKGFVLEMSEIFE
jgi:Uma2 family endonuclease